MNKPTKKEEAQPDPEDFAENERLKERLEEYGMLASGGNFSDIRRENAFLRMVIEQEEMLNGPQVPVRNLFPEGEAFPPADSLSEQQMLEILERIEDVLEESNIVVDLREGLPVSLRYAYVVNEVLASDFPLTRPDGTVTHFDGCDGGCDSCFQKKYCDAESETLGDGD